VNFDVSGRIPLAKAMMSVSADGDVTGDGIAVFEVAWKAPAGNNAYVYLHQEEGVGTLYKVEYGGVMDEMIALQGMPVTLKPAVKMPREEAIPIEEGPMLRYKAEMDVDGRSYGGWLENIRKSDTRGGVYRGKFKTSVFTWDDMKEEMDESGRIRGNLCFEMS
jgi:hypothetical protein